MIKRLLSIAVVLATSFASEGAASFVENLGAGHPQKIVCYGTSLTAVSHEWVDGLRGELDRRWPGLATVVNAGLSGKNSATGLANVQAKVVAERPDAVLIEFSMNDAADSLNGGKTAEQALADAESNLKSIIAAVRADNPNCEIILETMDAYVKVPGSNLSNRTDLDAHVAMYRRVAKEEGYLLIDTYPKWQEVLAKGTAEYLKLVPDGVHPNALGSRTVTLPNVLRTLGVDVVESSRDIPMIRDVDVLVVGGTFGAVSAAVAAKNAGASVFLAAPRRNLAEEVVLPRRLSRDPSDEPVADMPDEVLAAQSSKVPFAYSTDAATNSQKPDPNFTVLSDGKRGSAASQSVQYADDSVAWTITASGTEPVQFVALYYYYRPTGQGDFNVASIALETSADGQNYLAASATVTSSTVQTGLEYGDECRMHVLALAAPTDARHLRLTATRASGASRMLVGEIELWSGEGSTVSVPNAPLVFEKTLDARLGAAGVQFLAGAQACDVLKDGDGRVSGVVFADKSGRQAVRAKVVVDATEKGVVARKVASLRPVEDGNMVDFSLRMIAKSGLSFDLPGYAVEESAATSSTVSLYTGGDSSMVPSGAETSYAASMYTFTKGFRLTTDDWMDVNAIVQRMKTEIWTASAADVSEVPFYVSPLRMVGEAKVSAWTDSSSAPLGAFRPAGVPGLYALGQIADIDRALAGKLSLPGVETSLGARIGAAAAAEAAARPEVGPLTAGSASASAEALEVRERLDRPLGIGADASGVVRSLGGELPVLAVADVAVLGVGTSGGPAAIAALEKGRSVVGVDFLHTTGGVMTEGRIGKYYKGCNRGFSKNRVDPGTLSTGWVFSMAKAEWMRRTIVTNALATVLFGAQAEGVLTGGTDSSGRTIVRGLVVVLPDGMRGVVRADVVIDCTGNAEVAHMAGCSTQFLEAREFSMQGAGTTYHVLGSSYFNTDFGFLNTSDAGDLSNFARRARAGAKSGRYNVGDPSVSSRERRRIVGDIVVNERDILRRRKWSDTIMHGKSDYDMHGFSVSDALMYRERPHGTEFTADLPYRALIPAELEGVLATGLGISATRDAMPIIRMQRDVQNQGYAAGLAASAAIDAGSVRTIDVRALQQELVAIGSLDSAVLTQVDESVSDSVLASAVSELTTATFAGIEKILERPADARPLLAEAYAGAADESHRLACAIALVLVGDNSHLADVVAATEAADWTKGFDFRGLGNYGRQTAPVDYLMHTLVKSGDRDVVVPVLADMIAKLGPSAKLSHFRILTRAVDDLKAPELKSALSDVVSRSASLTNKTVSSVAAIPAHDVSGGDNSADDSERTRCIVELALARALHNAGDETGTAILTAYLDDVRTIYADYAALVLAAGTDSTPRPIKTEKLVVAGGTVNISPSVLTVTNGPARITDGGFEPKTALTTNDRNAQDKRSVRDADWLAENLPGWTFGPSDNNGSGICNNGSYFSNGSQLTNLLPGNKHCAFLRIDPTKNPTVGPGRIAQKFFSPLAGTPFLFSCRLAQRYYDGNTWSGKVALKVDGREVAVSDLVQTWSVWQVFSVNFTVESAGMHELSLEAVADASGVCDVLVDEVALGYAYERAITSTEPLAGLSLDLAAGTVLNLDAALAATMGGIRYDGERILGIVSAETYPSFVVGEGFVRTFGRFHITIQ